MNLREILHKLLKKETLPELWDGYKTIWDSSGDFNYTFPKEIADRGFAQLTSRLTKNHKGMTIWKIRFTIAATFLLLVGTGFVFYFLLRQDMSPTPIVVENHEEVFKEITLPDQSVITLAQHAKVTYDKDFGVANRHVQLSGYAYFDVRHVPQIPFVIHTEHITTTVVGTAFFIDARHQDSFSVWVNSGTVDVSRQHHHTHHMIHQHQRLSVNLLHDNWTIKDLNFSIDVNGKSKEVSFMNMAVQEVVETLAFYGQFTLHYPLEVKEVPITTTLPVSNPALCADIISAILDRPVYVARP
jgi:ferric-dicitrate binding protein FerR (iron transport regulator)